MPEQEVIRPVVRSFKERYARAASEHVRAGGHAIVWDAAGKATLVMREPRKGDEGDLGYWAILDLGKSRANPVKRGVLKGLATLRIPNDSVEIVKRWVERDSAFPGSTHALYLDCLDCGACCRDNKVILDDADIERFVKAGRGELAKAPYAKRKDGKVILVLRQDRDCKHLAKDNKCGIYPIRPSACSTFPMGSECCLFAREDELGITDGIPPS